MEKQKPHYDLSEMKRIVADPNATPFTKSARRDGSKLGLKPEEMREVVLSLNRSDFHKSMTTLHDNSLWQDVYHVNTQDNVPVYIKLTGYTDGRPVVISFKQLDEE